MTLILILGGTAEGRELAGRLSELPGVRVVSSLAGRVSEPRLPAGEVRAGGFGGADGLAAWLTEHAAGAVVDATHPFAARMTASAARAAAQTGTPLLVLRRPGWQPEPGDDWRWVPTLRDAADRLAAVAAKPARVSDAAGPSGSRVFLTTGRRSLPAFAHLDDVWFLVRSVDPPEPPLPQQTTVVLSRGPYTLDGELALLREHRIDVLVTKDSGGEMTAAKLAAARALRLPVVIVRRPPPPYGVRQVATVAEAVDWAQDVTRTQAG